MGGLDGLRKNPRVYTLMKETNIKKISILSFMIVTSWHRSFFVDEPIDETFK